MTSDDAHRVSLFVPGRLCLFGEHSDWAAEHGIHRGFCLVTGTDQGLSAMARPGESFVVETLIPDRYGRPSGRKRQMTCPWEEKMLMEAARDQNEFFRYCAGVARQMSSHPKVTGGLDLRITAMDLPLRKGVSSSAAVCILVARAFNEAYQLGMFPHELMEEAYRGEKLTGSQCGRMDQACIYGKTSVLLTFEKGKDIRVEPIFPQRDVYMLFVDLGGRKDTVRILADLQKAYPNTPRLQKALGGENERIMRSAYRAVGIGDPEEIGRLMTEAQRIFDELVAPSSPKELTSPLLHRVLALEDIAEHVYGGKGVGSQGDGTAQFVARSEADRDAAMRKIVAAFPEMLCFPLTLHRHAANQVARTPPES